MLTPLFVAATSVQCECAELLLEAGADAHHLDATGFSGQLLINSLTVKQGIGYVLGSEHL